MSETNDFDWWFHRPTDAIDGHGYWVLHLPEYTLEVGEFFRDSDGDALSVAFDNSDKNRMPQSYAVSVEQNGKLIMRSKNAFENLEDAKLAAMFEVRERLDNSIEILNALIKKTRNW